MRERGSSTARPKKKGVGGLPIGARPVDFGASIGARPVDFGASVVPIVPIGARPVDFGARPVDFGASVVPVVPVVPIWSAACVAISARRSCRSCRDLRTSSWRFVLIRSIRSIRVASKSRRKHKKSPIPQSGNRGSAIARRRALLTFCQFLFQILVQALEAFG